MSVDTHLGFAMENIFYFFTAKNCKKVQKIHQSLNFSEKVWLKRALTAIAQM